MLVNEYGLIGVDAALLEPVPESGQPKGVELREVAGGCICCSAGFMFEASLVLLLQRRPDRLLIEPTGLAAVSGILDTLDRQRIREAVDVRSVVCLLDPTRFNQDLQREEVRDQVEAADVLLATRPDLSSSDQFNSFRDWAESLFPPKRVIGEVLRGALSHNLLDVVSQREGPAHRRGHRHGTDHSHAHEHGRDEHDHERGAHNHDAHPVAIPLCDEKTPIVQRSHRSSLTSTMGWVCWAGLLFDADRTERWLRGLAGLPGMRRTKAVMRTTEGWWAFNFTDGVHEIRPSAHRRDSRLEVVCEGDQMPDATELDAALRACLNSGQSAA